METPTQREVLEQLAEAGDENLPTLLNTILLQHPAASPPELLEQVAAAVESLERREYAVFSWYRGGWQRLTPAERAALSPLAGCVVWDATDGDWDWDSARLGDEWPVLTITGAGRRRLRAPHHSG